MGVGHFKTFGNSIVMSPRRALWAGMFEGGWLGLGAYAAELLTSAPPERWS